MSISYNIAGVLSFEKKLVQVGCGKYLPNDFSVCRVLIRCEENIEDEIGYALNHETEVVVGGGKTYAECVVDICLQTMKQEERCLVCCTLNHGSGDRHLELDVMLVSFQSGVEIFNLSVSEKESRAIDLKELGAAAFRSGDIRAAFYKFSRSLKYMSCVISDKEEASRVQSTEASVVPQLEASQGEHDELLCQCLLNIAACQLRHKSYRLAKVNCTRAISLEPTNVKGLFRRARCLVELGQVREAVVDLERAASLEPTNREVLKLLRSVKEEERRSDEVLAKAMGKMFQAN